MNPVLIFTDTERIADEQETIGNIIAPFQAIYNALKAAGVTAPTIADINALVENAKKQSQTAYVFNYVQSKLVAQISPFVVNGTTMNQAFVQGSIQMPNLAAITAALQPFIGYNAQSIFTSGLPANWPALLQIAADVISLVPTAMNQIAALYTYYTQSDASVTLVNGLQAVCDALNTFDEANDSFFALKTPPAIPFYAGGGKGTAIPGLDIREGIFVIDLEFIRQFESNGSLNFIRNA